jgi:hypothetical protein
MGYVADPARIDFGINSTISAIEQRYLISRNYVRITHIEILEL